MTGQAPGLNVVLCEGYDDRSFWSGWIQFKGCAVRKGIPDIYGRMVGGGRFHFHTPRQSSVVIRSYGGRANLTDTFLDELKDHRKDYRIRRLVLNLDSDAEAGEERTGARDAIRQIAVTHGAQVDDPTRESFEIDGMTVSTVIWECSDDSAVEGVPRQQTLERLVSASIQAAYPGRGAAVERWLADEPEGGTGHKNYGLSFLAKWYADHGADDFYRAVWRDQNVAEQLRSRLEATGAWAVAEALVAD